MRTLERLLLPLFGILVVLLCWQPLVVGSDFWSHAAVGRWIVEHQAVPHGALFIWTYSGPWLAHSWLSEIGCYALMALGGEGGGPVLAVALTALVGLAIFAVALWPIIARDKRLPLLIGASALVALLCCTNRLVPRPEVLTTFFTVCLYSALTRLRDNEPSARRKYERKLLIGLPLLFVCWTNLHGAVIYGLAALWLAALCDAAQYRDRTSRTVLLAAALSTGAILVNPYGARYLLIYTPLARHSFYYIGEWLPFWTTPRVDVKLPIYELTLTLTAIAVWLKNREKRWSNLAWLMMAAASFIQARRNMDLLALTALVVIVRSYPAACEALAARPFATARPARGLRALGTLATGALAANMLWMAGVLLATQSGGAFAKATRQAMPSQQAAVVASLASPRLKMLNLYNSAAYLEWRLAGSVPLYIDGLNAYPDGVYRAWRQMWDASPLGIAKFESSGVNCVMAEHIAAHGYAPSLVNYLAASPDWLMIYDGDDGAVLVRRELLPASPVVSEAAHLSVPLRSAAPSLKGKEIVASTGSRTVFAVRSAT